MSDAAEDLEDMIERGRDQPAEPGFLRRPFRRKPKKDRTATWVARLNRLSRELDEAAAALHPSAWPEQLKTQMDEYRKMAGRGP